MRVLGFDTETDGLIKNGSVRIEKQPRIIELFGLVLNENDEEIDKWWSFFSHPKPLDKDITRITGITDEMLRDAPPFIDKAKEIKALIESCDRVYGHNLTFDRDMVNNEFLRIGLELPHWPAEMICTVEATEYIKGYRLSLTLLHKELFGEDFKGAHRAEGDVRAMTKCYIELRKRGIV